jgi:hypothetical protein
MKKDMIALIVALIAAITSFASAGLSYVGSSSLEREKWMQAREDETKRQLRVALADFAREMATGAQSVVWLLWIAENNPRDFGDKHVADYLEEMRATLPRHFGALMLVAAYDRAAYEKLRASSDALNQFHIRIAGAIKTYRGSRESGLKDLQAIARDVTKWRRALSEELVQAISLSAKSAPPL